MNSLQPMVRKTGEAKRETQAEALKRRLKEAEETLGAIRRGEVDALVLSTEKGDQVFTLRSADHPYRILVESMAEGALTLSLEGVILYSNHAFSEMVKLPSAQIIGKSVLSLVETENHDRLTRLLGHLAAGESAREEFQLAPSGTAPVPALVSASRLALDGGDVICVVLTDLSQIRAAEGELRRARDELELRVDERTAQLVEARNVLELRVLERTAELRRLTDYLERIREEESRRISGEIHDELGAALTSAKMELAWLRQSLRQESQVKKAEAISSLLDELVQSIRRIAHDLRPSVLDAFGLAAGIEALVDEFRLRSGVECGLRVDDGLEVLGSSALALYRICQEALTNVLRHAEAERVDVSLSMINDRVILEVTDDGKGIPEGRPLEAGCGLLGMRERARRLGGELNICSVEQEGTRVEAWIPTPAELSSGTG
jgi:two-component system, NarL family, sensor kinase